MERTGQSRGKDPEEKCKEERVWIGVHGQHPHHGSTKIGERKGRRDSKLENFKTLSLGHPDKVPVQIKDHWNKNEESYQNGHIPVFQDKPRNIGVCPVTPITLSDFSPKGRPVTEVRKQTEIIEPGIKGPDLEHVEFGSARPE